jgi:hypothetical protein
MIEERLAPLSVVPRGILYSLRTINPAINGRAIITKVPDGTAYYFLPTAFGLLHTIFSSPLSRLIIHGFQKIFFRGTLCAEHNVGQHAT